MTKEKSKAKNSTGVGPCKLARLTYLSKAELAFVMYFNGDATEAALLAGYAKKSAQRSGNNLLQRPKVMEAIARKNEAALKQVEKEAETVVEIFRREGVDAQFLARNIYKIVNSSRHPKSGHSAHVAAIKVAAEVLKLIGRGPALPGSNVPGAQSESHNYVDGEGRRFFMYRSAWKDDDGDTSNSRVAPPRAALPANNG